MALLAAFYHLSYQQGVIDGRKYRPKLLEKDSGDSTRTKESVMGTGGALETKGMWSVVAVVDQLWTRCRECA